MDLELPANYAFRFRLRGEAPANHLEFKLVDASGENVWWKVRRDVAWPAGLADLPHQEAAARIRLGSAGRRRDHAGRRHRVRHHRGHRRPRARSGSTTWNWSPLPAADRPAAGPGGRGEFRGRGSRTGPGPGRRPGHLLDARAADDQPCLVARFPAAAGIRRPDGGLGAGTSGARLRGGSLGRREMSGASCRRSPAATAAATTCILPESESRLVRLRLTGPDAGGAAVSGAGAQAPGLVGHAGGLLHRPSPPSRRAERMPRGFLGEQVVLDGGGGRRRQPGRIAERRRRPGGGPGGFTVEPFLFVDGELVTWNDVIGEQSLRTVTCPSRR